MTTPPDALALAELLEREVELEQPMTIWRHYFRESATALRTLTASLAQAERERDEARITGDANYTRVAKANRNLAKSKPPSRRGSR